MPSSQHAVGCFCGAVQPAFAQGYGGSAEAIHVIAPAEAGSQQSSCSFVYL